MTGHRRSDPERGQASVELVLVLPVLAVLVLTLVQIGVIARDRQLLAHAAREAARAAAVDPDPAVASTAGRAATGLAAERLTVRLGPERDPGQRLTLTVTYAAPTDVPLVGALVGDIDLATEVTVRIE